MLLIFWACVIVLYLYLLLSAQLKKTATGNQRQIEIEDLREISLPQQHDLLKSLIEDFPFKQIEDSIKISVIPSVGGSELHFKAIERMPLEKLCRKIISCAEYLGFIVFLEYLEDSIQGCFYAPEWGRYAHLEPFKFTIELQSSTSLQAGVLLQETA